MSDEHLDTQPPRTTGVRTDDCEQRVVSTFCSLCGPTAGCGLDCYVRDGRLVRVDGMTKCPVNRGKLCSKAFVSPQWLYSPDRLKHPLKRIGKKGENRFERITWDEALDLIATKLQEQKQEYGPESLVVLSPQHRTYKDYFLRFLTVHGSPNYAHSGICFEQRAFGFAYTTGIPLLGFAGAADFEHTDLAVIWGANPVSSGTPMGTIKRILNARARGAKLLVIKPEMQADAAKADVWLPVRPGTDTALALAMLNVIVNEGLYDVDFVSRWCHGFEELRAHVQQYTPEWAEPITGLSAAQISEAARMYATASSACILVGNAFDQMTSTTDAVRAIGIMIAITGNLDRPGGNVARLGNTMPPLNPVRLDSRFSQELLDKLVAPEFPPPFQPFLGGLSSAYYRCLDAVLTERPYAPKTIVAAGTQPPVITRGPKRVVEALEKLDFLVVVDVMNNAAMPWADVVVPVATPYECDHPFELARAGTKGWLMARNKVVEPLGDYKSDYEFWLDLAVKMGYGDDFWHGSIEECMNYQLEPLGITIDELREHPEGITYDSRPMVYEKYEQILTKPSLTLSKEPYLPQGKVAIYNTTFEELGYSPLPQWVEPPENHSGSPELVDEYPLAFFDTHTSHFFNHGWLRNIPYLREAEPDPWIHVHPETAKARGIEDGEWVFVRSPHGEIKARAFHFPGIRPDTVMGLHGWWQECRELGMPGYPVVQNGASTNSLYSSDPATFDPLSSAMAKQTLVEIRRCAGGQDS